MFISNSYFNLANSRKTAIFSNELDLQEIIEINQKCDTFHSNFKNFQDGPSFFLFIRRSLSRNVALIFRLNVLHSNGFSSFKPFD